MKKPLAKIKELLLKQQKEVESEIELIDQDDPVNASGPDESSEPGTDSWLADTHTRAVAIKMTLQKSLANIKKSLLAINSGKYGKCENCGKEIEEKRLAVMPTATLCIQCNTLKAKK